MAVLDSWGHFAPVATSGSQHRGCPQHPDPSTPTPAPLVQLAPAAPSHRCPSVPPVPGVVVPQRVLPADLKPLPRYPRLRWQPSPPEPPGSLLEVEEDFGIWGSLPHAQGGQRTRLVPTAGHGAAGLHPELFLGIPAQQLSTSPSCAPTRMLPTQARAQHPPPSQTRMWGANSWPVSQEKLGLGTWGHRSAQQLVPSRFLAHQKLIPSHPPRATGAPRAQEPSPQAPLCPSPAKTPEGQRAQGPVTRVVRLLENLTCRNQSRDDFWNKLNDGGLIQVNLP